MRFQPSAYSDVAASAPPAGVSEEAAASATKLATQVVGMGLDSWQASADARANKWRTLAAKKAKKAKKIAAAKAAQRQQAMPPPPAAPPAPIATGMDPWMKWGLIAAGIGVVSFAAFMLLRRKQEPKPKPNPKRTFGKSPPKTRVIRVRPAATEIPETIEVEEVEEVEDLRNPARDEDDGYGDGYDGVDEGDE